MPPVDSERTHKPRNARPCSRASVERLLQSQETAAQILALLQSRLETIEARLAAHDELLIAHMQIIRALAPYTDN